MYEQRLIFHALENTGWTIALIVVGLLALGCVVLLYRYERQLISRKLGMTLLALRVLVVLTVLIALFEPVLSWERDRARSGRVLVAVDVSESMQTQDSHALPGEKLRWARALGMIGNDQTDERLDRWQAAFDLGEEPEWVTLDEESDPAAAAELAQFRKEQLQQVFDEIDELSRQEIVERLLAGPQSQWLQELQEIAEVDFEVFAGNTASTDATSLASMLNEPADSLEVGASNIAAVLQSAAGAAENRQLLGTILITDGRTTIDPEESTLEEQADLLGSAIFPVQIGSELPIRDIALAHIDAPSAVFKDDTPSVKVTLRTAGFEGRPLRVTLNRQLDSDSPDESESALSELVQEQTITPSGPVTEITFELQPQSTPGRYRYIARSDLQPDEIRDDNNELGATINIVDSNIRVLVLEGEARWEFRFLEIALNRDSRVDVDSIVFEQPYLGVLPDTFFARRLTVPSEPNPAEPTPFSGYDVVIVGDASPRDLRRATWELLDRYVRSEGGTLMMVSGKRHMPLEYQHEILRNLLPVENLAPFEISSEGSVAPPDERGYRLRLTPEAEALAMFQFADDPAENPEVWARLPGVEWGLRGELKGGASVWAVALNPESEQTLETERSSVTLAHQYVGAGQVVWSGVDSTWRWRHRRGDQYHHRFWGQLVRWAAQFKASAGNEFVRFGAQLPVIEFGEEASLIARFEPGVLQNAPEFKAIVEIRPANAPESGAVAVLELNADADTPSVYTAQTATLPSGEYQAVLIVSGTNRQVPPVESELTVLAPPTSEKSDVSANPLLLASLADASEGQLISLDQLNSLPSLLQADTGEDSRRQETRLWDSWWLLLLFCGLVTTEWVLRKLNGLP